MDGDLDNDLVQSAKNGDKAALEELCVKHYSWVFGIVNRMLQGNGDVADRVQNVFVKVRLSIGTFNGRSKFSTWLYRITLNECLDYFKKPEFKRTVPLHGTRSSQNCDTDSGDASDETPILGASRNIFSEHLARLHEQAYLDLVKEAVDRAYGKMEGKEIEAVELTQIDGVDASTTAAQLGFEEPKRVYDIAAKFRRLLRRELKRSLGAKKKVSSGVNYP
jgi:RNA polymerase sigma factor (sigma-70 family)